MNNLKTVVIDTLARASGERYSTFDVVGAGPRIIAGIAELYSDVYFYPFEKALVEINSIIDADLVLISAMSSDYNALGKILGKIRSHNYKGRVIVGGPISFEYEKVLLNLPVDYVVIGEGEIPLLNIFSKLKEKGEFNPTEIPALAYRVGSSVKTTGRHLHTPIEILDSIKPWTRVDEAFNHPQIYRFYVEVVRGCSNFQRPLITTEKYNCINCLNCRSPILENRLVCPVGIPPGCGFCSVPYMFGPPRSRSIKSIKREVEELIQHGARRIVLSGPDFLDYMREKLVSNVLTNPCYPPANKEAIEGLLNELSSIPEVESGRVVVMIENIKACLVDEEVGRILGKYLKGTTIHIGLETGSDEFNEKILGKPILLKHVVEACRILRAYGLRPYVYLMYGLPFASEDVYRDTLKAISVLGSVGVEKITLYKFTSLPATAFEGLKPEIDSYLELIKSIKNTIDKYNMAMKRKLLGEKLEVWLVKSKKKIYGYPVKHGPVVFVEYHGRRNLTGCRGLVKIVDIGPRFVKGVLVSILECPGN